jgi:Ca-activated chloride channel family protein
MRWPPPKPPHGRGSKSTIGIGTPEGAPIRIGGDFIKDEEGKMVVSKLDEQTLEQIALTTGGGYIRATNRSLGLDEIVQKIGEVEKKQLTESIFEDFSEQYQYPLAVGLALLLLDFLIPERRSRLLDRLNIFRKKNDSGDPV